MTGLAARPGRRAFAGLMLAGLAGLPGLAVAQAGRPERSFVRVATGPLLGLYYPIGGAICRLTNRGRRTHGVRCGVDTTEGSVANLLALRAGEVDLAITQSDWQFHAYHGTDIFERAGAFDGLRSLCSLHPEPITVIARSGSGIRSFKDLPGKRVNLGQAGSGQRATIEALLGALGWTLSDFPYVGQATPDELPRVLCDGTVDAVVLATGHPNGAVNALLRSCDATLVPVVGAEIDALVDGLPYYSRASIPASFYGVTYADVQTFGIRATLVATDRMPEATAYTIVRSMFESLEAFRAEHPALAGLSATEMAKEGLSAPLHDGAARYLRETRLI